MHQAIHKSDIELQSKTASGTLFVELAENKNLLQSSLTKLEEWSETSNISLNRTKTKEFIIRKNRMDIETDTIHYTDNSEVSKATSCERVLGIWIDNKLNFSEHVARLVKKITPRLYWLKSLKSAGVDEETLILLYTTHLRSAISYAAAAWYPHTNTTARHKLERLQKLALKRINSTLTYELALKKFNIEKLTDFLCRLQCAHFENLLNCDHPLHHLIPPLCGAQSGRNTRQSEQMCITYNTLLRKNSFIVNSAALYNNDM